MNIQDYYKYAQFSALAYVDWRNSSWGDQASFTDAIIDANEARRIPGAVDLNNPIVDTLGEKIFSPVTEGGQGWMVADFHPNDASGFKVSFFTNSTTGEKVLSISGTEPTTGWGLPDLVADLHEIGDLGMAISQSVSLYNYVQRLKAPELINGVPNTSVLQLELISSNAPPSSGSYVTAPLVPLVYYSVVPSNTGTGLGLLDPADNVTITGHSLGGHLAAVGNRLFPGLFDNAVTFNAPGFDPALSGHLTDQFVNTLFGQALGVRSCLANFGLYYGLYMSPNKKDVQPHY